MKAKIRVGLLIDEYIQPYWIYKMIAEIKKQDVAEIRLIVKNQQENTQNKSAFKKAIEQYKNIFYQLYRVVENKISKPHPNAFELKDISGIIDLASTPVIEVAPIRKVHSDYFKDEDMAEINKHEIDVFIRLGFRILRGKILKSARYGIWSYHHGDNRVNRGGPAGVWESLKRWDETGAILQILTEDLDGGEVLYRSWSCTDRDFINKNLNTYYWSSAFFLPRTLKRLYDIGEEKFFHGISEKNQHPEFYSNRLFKKPQNFEFLRLITAKAFKLSKYVIWRLFNFEQWILLYSFKKGDIISTSIHRYKKMIPDKKIFWADPCVIFKDGKHFIFLEEYLYKTKKGHISVIEMENGNFKPAEKVLDKEYHLSYPFVFESEGVWYMIPESMEKMTVELYKSVEFPLKWEFVMNLMEDVHALDTTIHFQNGKFWLFVNLKWHPSASSDELYLFHADSLITNDWIPHPQNPIVSDVKTARPAGKLFYYNNNLYRPSQDCSQKYGRAINLNQVLTLDEENYEETTVSRIEPNWDKKITRTHTFSSGNGLSVIDGYMNRRR